jgi:hypothetical protein
VCALPVKGRVTGLLGYSRNPISPVRNGAEMEGVESPSRHQMRESLMTRLIGHPVIGR